MKKRAFFHTLLFGLLLGLTLPSAPLMAQSLQDTASALDNLADMARQADRSRDVYQRALDSSATDADRWKRDWMDRERNLENLRLKALSDYGKVRLDTLRNLRDSGTSWGDLARRYNLDPSRLGYGFSPYDRDRDSWKGTPPGLAKKGGVPPGLAKQDREDQFYDRGNGNGKGKGGNDKSYKTKDYKDGKGDKGHKGGKGGKGGNGKGKNF